MPQIQRWNPVWTRGVIQGGWLTTPKVVGTHPDERAAFFF